jgi:hypothetical protein
MCLYVTIVVKKETFAILLLQKQDLIEDLPQMHRYFFLVFLLCDYYG